jgi:hypothetical protein
MYGLHFFIGAKCVSGLQCRNPTSVESGTPPKFFKELTYNTQLFLFCQALSAPTPKGVPFVANPAPYDGANANKKDN